MSHSKPIWRFSQSPNYSVNVDKRYPYSEVPYIGEYKLIKVPIEGELLDLVDYWGEGRITVLAGSSGFTNAYNVNHEYQLVSNGPDRGRKIPNRIPVSSYHHCDTSSYIKDNSVKLVTLMGAPINASCAADIARITNDSIGKVVVYGFDSAANDIRHLETELSAKGLFFCDSYELTNNEVPTLFDIHRVYINVDEIKKELQKRVVEGNYDRAVNITKTMETFSKSMEMTPVVEKLLGEGNKKIMPYAYRLWHGGDQDIVTKLFGSTFKLIFNEADVKIVSKTYNMHLRVEGSADSMEESTVLGNDKDFNSEKIRWKLIPKWDDVSKNVHFRLYNINANTDLKLDDNIGNDGKVCSAKWKDIDNFKWFLEPVKIGEDLVFFIVNKRYRQGLKLDAEADINGARQLRGHSGAALYGAPDLFTWLILPWKDI